MFNPLYPIKQNDENILSIGQDSKLYELEDKDGAIFTLLTMLDGSKTTSQLHDGLRKKFPHVTLEDIQQVIQALNELGFIIDLSIKETSSLSSYEQERFKANIHFFSHFSEQLAIVNEHAMTSQEKLCSSTVTIIGMGGFGSSVLFNLAGLGIKKVRIVDFDTVSLSNLNRQFLFNEKDIGKKKINVAQTFMQDFYSNMQIEAVDKQINHPEVAEEVIVGSDVVVLAADQPTILLQRWVNSACVNQGIPFIGGGIAIDHGQISTVIPKQTGCVDCMHLHRLQNMSIYRQHIQSSIETPFTPPNMATPSNLMMVAGMIGSELTKLLTGIAPLQSNGKVIYFNLLTFKTEIIGDWPRMISCPTCGDQPDSSFKEQLQSLFTDQQYTFMKKEELGWN